MCVRCFPTLSPPLSLSHSLSLPDDDILLAKPDYGVPLKYQLQYVVMFSANDISMFWFLTDFDPQLGQRAMYTYITRYLPFYTALDYITLYSILPLCLCLATFKYTTCLRHFSNHTRKPHYATLHYTTPCYINVCYTTYSIIVYYSYYCILCYHAWPEYKNVLFSSYSYSSQKA